MTLVILTLPLRLRWILLHGNLLSVIIDRQAQVQVLILLSKKSQPSHLNLHLDCGFLSIISATSYLYQLSLSSLHILSPFSQHHLSILSFLSQLSSIYLSSLSFFSFLSAFYQVYLGSLSVSLNTFRGGWNQVVLTWNQLVPPWN